MLFAFFRLVFSQSLIMLDLIESFLLYADETRGEKCCPYKGKYTVYTGDCLTFLLFIYHGYEKECVCLYCQERKRGLKIKIIIVWTATPVLVLARDGLKSLTTLKT